MDEGDPYVFLQRRYTNGQQLEKMLNITNHQRNTNETPVRYHFTPVRMAIIKNKTKQKHLQKTSVCKDVEKLEPCTLLVGFQNGSTLWKTVQRFLKKIKNRATI